MTYERTRLHERALAGEPMDCLVIDAHAHLMTASSANAYVPAADAEGMLDSMDALGIDVACLSILGAGDQNGLMLDVVEEHPERFAGFVLINPRYPGDMVDVLETCFRHPAVRGIGEVHPTSYSHDYPVTGPNYVPAWEFAEQRRLPVLIHAGPTSELDRCRPADLGKVAAAHPGMNVLIGHAGGYDSWDMLEEAIDTARRHDNVFLELCAMGRYPGIVEYIVDRLDDEKVVFGTDAPFHDWTAEIAHVAFARLPDSSKERIFGGTMQSLMNESRVPA
ncbi:amidohydrolase family protein [Agromyces aerolatus]|uniref:amidohydrolase family protein n=1 Tax=Agromyces sp. LY-1074 TaxID=3074080 RepID=UPI002856A020|nr:MULTISPECIES: amidohydrolase family protein [unclassified Agromyces]MDR5700845.1 amidohydrolase family protein [Agromyces sp. LY-1074]MDR5707494.1 amidohydrolase family protein [Agromyces sp. LY-1358]